MLEYLLEGHLPSLSPENAAVAIAHLSPYVPTAWRALGPQTIAGELVPAVFEPPTGERIGIIVRHALRARADASIFQRLLISGVRLYEFTDFDLIRRPFWAINQVGI